MSPKSTFVNLYKGNKLKQVDLSLELRFNIDFNRKIPYKSKGIVHLFNSNSFKLLLVSLIKFLQFLLQKVSIKLTSVKATMDY